MKRYILDFLRRGLAAMGFGPMVLAVLYLLLPVQTLTAQAVSLGSFSLSALAFLAGGLNVLYQIERLPLMAAIGIHGAMLYLGYLLTYLLNGWLDWGRLPVLVFTAIFAVGYLAIWAVIYAIMRRSTARVNALLKRRQRSEKP